MARKEPHKTKFKILLGLVLILVSTPLLIYTNCGNISDISQESVSLDPTQNDLSGPACLTGNKTTGCIVDLIANGGNHTCAVVNGGVKCWGDNSFGQLGNGTTTSSLVPVAIPNLTGVTAIEAGRNETCVIAAGVVKCWGDNSFGQLGNGTTTGFSSSPVTVSNLTGATAISVGGHHVCAINGSQKVKCWGFNNSGQLGLGNTINASTPQLIPNLSNVITISAGVGHSCAIISGGTAQCWGSNSSGQLGIGVLTFNKLVPTPVANVTLATAIESGEYQTCALRSNSTIKCWGNGNPIATQIAGITNAVAIDLGEHHVCANLSSGNTKCWGENVQGQLGNGSTSTIPVATPVPVTNISNATAIEAGGSHTCVIVNGQVKCWGFNLQGQLGNSSVINSSVALSTVGLTLNVTAIASGDAHDCAIVSGLVKCWGSNARGQLGNPTSLGGNSSAPLQVTGITNAIAIVGGEEHTCALILGGTIMCWGDNQIGELGNPTALGSYSVTPLPVTGITNAIAISVGTSEVQECAVLSTGQVKCWGNNQFGQLGNPTAVGSFSATPLLVTGITNAVAVATGWNHSCVVLSTGGVQCFGWNQKGQLGNPTALGSFSATPLSVTGITNGISVVLGGAHSCAMLSTGQVNCWGDNAGGQLGNGSMGGTTTTPTTVVGIANAVMMSAQDNSACAVTTGGQVKCWGVMGGGSWPNSSLPITATSVANVVEMTMNDIPSGNGAFCAITSCDVQCWNDNTMPPITIQGL